jgi:light-regulated signal transduction histidine kinase (bacteriophytochrome)
VNDAVKMLAPTVPRDVRVTVDIGTSEARVLGDATMIHQVLANLLRNAVQAMDGAGELRVGLDVVRVDAEMATKLAPLRVGRHVRIEVSFITLFQYFRYYLLHASCCSDHFIYRNTDRSECYFPGAERTSRRLLPSSG